MYLIGGMKMTQVCICYPTVLWVSYEALIMSDRCGSLHIPQTQHDHKLHPGHAQILPWFLDPRAWNMHLTSVIVVQGWWYMYGSAIPLIYMCDITLMKQWVAYQYIYHCPWTTTPLVRYMVQALGSEIRIISKHVRVVVGGHDMVWRQFTPVKCFPCII